MTFKSLFGQITILSLNLVNFRVPRFHVSHLTHETFKLHLQNTLNMSKTARVYFRVLHLAPKPIEQPKLMSITEDGQGNLQINFEPIKEHPRRSYSASSSNSFLEIQTPSRRSNVQSHLNLEEVDNSSTIPNLKYTRTEQNIQNSPDRSPTYSQMMSPNEEPS